MISFPGLPAPQRYDPSLPFARNNFMWRSSDSPLIDWVWATTISQDVRYIVTADGCLDLAVIKRNGKVRMWLSGPTTRAHSIAVRAGTETVSIRLRPGVHLANVPAEELVGIERFLPNAGNHSFWLQTTALQFPSFDNAEIFIERLHKLGLLRHDPIVNNTLAGRLHGGINVRTVQRHFKGAVGLTPYYVFQIQRAEQARRLLTTGISATQVASDMGFSDQAHLTRSLKYLLGRIPSQVSSV